MTKLQSPNDNQSFKATGLGIGNWNLFGYWCLEFGISTWPMPETAPPGSLLGQAAI